MIRSRQASPSGPAEPLRRGRPREFDREAALIRAVELFWENGFEGTSLKGLTKAMGISAPSLYAAFGSKEDLFREAVEFYNDPQRSPTARALRDEPSARAAVEALLRENARSYADPQTPRGCLIVLSATTYTPASTGMRDLLRDLRDRDRRDLRLRLDRAVADGELSGSADTSALTGYVMTVLHGLSTQARDGADASTLDAIVDLAMSGWEHAVRQSRS